MHSLWYVYWHDGEYIDSLANCVRTLPATRRQRALGSFLIFKLGCSSRCAVDPCRSGQQDGTRIVELRTLALRQTIEMTGINYDLTFWVACHLGAIHGPGRRPFEVDALVS